MAKSVLTIREARPDDQNAWDLKVAHPLQSWAWGEFRKKMGLAVVSLGVYEGDSLIEGWQMTFHPIPHTRWTIGYFPKGPAPTRKMIDSLADIEKTKNAIFVQLEPNIAHGTQIPKLSALKPSHHPLFTRYTFILDLTKSEDELLSLMHHKTRYNIKVAQKNAVVVREDNSPKAFAAYLALSKETTQRQGFFAHTERYHTEMWDTMYKAGIAHLFTASYQGRTLAAWIVFRWKDTLYYPYGSSSRDNREVMAPTLLLWEIARWAKHHGIKQFDLWGAMGPHPDEHDPWYGFHRFKAGFNPDLVEYAGSYDLVLRPSLYKLYTIADTFRWKLLRAKK